MEEVSQMTPDEINEIITNNKIRLNTNDDKKLSKLFPRIKNETQLSAILNETVGLFNKIDKWFQGTTMFTRAESNAMIYRYDCKKHSTNYSNIPSNVCRLFDMQQKQIHNILKAALSSHPLPPPLSFKEPILRCKIFLESINSLKDSLGITNNMTKMTSMIRRKSDEELFKDLLDSIVSSEPNAMDETLLTFKYKYKKLKDYFETEQPFNNFLFGAITKDDRQTTRFDILFDTAQQKDRPDISKFLESKYQRSQQSQSQQSQRPIYSSLNADQEEALPLLSSYVASSYSDWQSERQEAERQKAEGVVTVPGDVNNGDVNNEEEEDPRSPEELTRQFEANLNQARQEPSSNGNGSENADDGTSTVPKKNTTGVTRLFSSWNRDKAETEDPTASLIGKKSSLFNRAKNAFKGTLKYAMRPSRENQTDTDSDSSTSSGSEGKDQVTENPLQQSKGGKKTRKRRKPRKTRRKKQKKSKRKTKAKK